jgi:hypothetical protein
MISERRMAGQHTTSAERLAESRNIVAFGARPQDRIRRDGENHEVAEDVHDLEIHEAVRVDFPAQRILCDEDDEEERSTREAHRPSSMSNCSRRLVVHYGWAGCPVTGHQLLGTAGR